MRTCKHCKETFDTDDKPLGWMANHTRWCHKNPNRNKSKRARKPKVCPGCEIKFIGRNKYCSPECKNKNKNCEFCEKECKNDNSLRNHQRLCKLNPDRQTTPFQDKEKQKEIAAVRGSKNQWSDPNYKMSNETRLKLSNAAKGRRHSEETKANLSRMAKERKFGGVTQSRWIKYKGKTLGSSYELEVVKSLDANNIRWDTCTSFNYIDPNGKQRTYTPDIYLVDYDVYLDPKNDFLIENINPSLGFKDSEKIQRVSEQNNITVFILNKDQLCWTVINNIIHQ